MVHSLLLPHGSFLLQRIHIRKSLELNPSYHYSHSCRCILTKEHSFHPQPCLILELLHYQHLEHHACHYWQSQQQIVHWHFLHNTQSRSIRLRTHHRLIRLRFGYRRLNFGILDLNQILPKQVCICKAFLTKHLFSKIFIGS